MESSVPFASAGPITSSVASEMHNNVSKHGQKDHASRMDTPDAWSMQQAGRRPSRLTLLGGKQQG